MSKEDYIQSNQNVLADLNNTIKGYMELQSTIKSALTQYSSIMSSKDLNDMLDKYNTCKMFIDQLSKLRDDRTLFIDALSAQE